ncbi:MAG: hypothetical protein Q9195_006787 [Heterodermia aff. obscurata]
MSDNVLTYLLGNPDSRSFDTRKRAEPSWFIPDLPVLRSSSQPEARTCSFAELKAQVKALGSGLRKAGIQDGDRVILMSPHTVEFGMLMLGTWAAGGICVARDVGDTAAQQADFFKLVEPKIVIVETAYKDTAAEAVRLVYPNFISIYELDVELPETLSSVGNFSWRSLLDRTGGPSYAWPRISTKEQMESTILIEYTSGTTGAPKGVEHTHRSFINLLKVLPPNSTSATQPRCLSDFTWAHIGCKITFLTSLMTRTCLILYDHARPFSIATYLSQALQHQPRTIAMTKRTLDALVLHDEALTTPDLSFVHSILTGAQTIPLKTRLAVMELCCGRNILSVGYGCTEALRLTRKVPDTSQAPSSSVGTLISSVHGKVVDIAGNPLENGQEGRLLFRTPMLMKGYWKDPETTAIAVDAEGFLDSGDLGFVDKATGEWHITGRRKEVIRFGGVMISAQSIEEILMRIPNVGPAIVVEVLRADGEEMPVAFILRAKEGLKQPQTKNVHDFMQRETDTYRQITGGLVWLNKAELPYGGDGKVARMALKHLAQSLWDENKLEGGYAS